MRKGKISILEISLDYGLLRLFSTKDLKCTNSYTLLLRKEERDYTILYKQGGFSIKKEHKL